METHAPRRHRKVTRHPARITAPATAEMVDALDRVADAAELPRAEVIRRAVERLDDAIRRSCVGEEIAESYRKQPQSSGEDAAAMAAAIAPVEAESWVWTEDGRCMPECAAIEQGIPVASGPPNQPNQQSGSAPA